MNVGVKRAWVLDEEAETLQQEIAGAPPETERASGAAAQEQGEHSEGLIREK